MAEKSVGGINKIEFNIGNGKLANTAKPVLTAARTVQGMNKKNSLSAMTKDLIMQYPVYLDSNIPYDSQVTIVKALEKLYASLQLALWSADTAFGVDPTSTGGVRDFVRKYHVNSDTPDMISYAGNLTRNISAYRGEYESSSTPAQDSALFNEGDEVEVLHMTSIENRVGKSDIEKMWDTVEDRVCMESVNALYSPTNQMVSKIHRTAAALEASTDEEIKDAFTDPENATPAAKRTFRDKYNSVGDNGYKADVYMGRTEAELATDRKSLTSAALVNNKQLSSLEPTLMQVEFFVRDSSGHGGKIQKAIIGVKAMPRIVKASAMASNIVAAIQGNHAAFQFVKWTRGETKIVRDLIFNISQIKKDAITKDRFDGYFGAMRKRRNNAKAFKFGDQTVNPFTTLVISMQTVEQVKAAAGYDLTDVTMAKRLMNALYLLGIQIVDTETNVVSTILDEWDGYASTTIKAMSGVATKDIDENSMSAAMKIMGATQGRYGF